MEKIQEERAKKLADEHWGYISELLCIHGHGQGDNMLEILSFYYKSAMIHGYKHALQDEGIEEKMDNFKFPDFSVEPLDIPHKGGIIPPQGISIKPTKIKFEEGNGHD